MKEKGFITASGTIHYWINLIDSEEITLVLLPGLTADHHLFEKQVECFERKYNLLIWDPPAHASSWPFQFNFTLIDEAKWLNEILVKENLKYPVIIGQSMGGYIGQVFSQLYPDRLKGFISVDSAPLQRMYITKAELWLLKQMEPIYYYYPWNWLLKSGTKGVATSDYGRKLMYKTMKEYDGDKKRYSKIAGHGMKILAKAIELDLPYKLECPTLLICGEKDRAGSCKRYNKLWSKNTGFPIAWIPNAGHNSNTDNPKIVNQLIEMFISDLN